VLLSLNEESLVEAQTAIELFLEDKSIWTESRTYDDITKRFILKHYSSKNVIVNQNDNGIVVGRTKNKSC